MNNADDITKVDLPTDLVARVEGRVKYTDFDNTTEYISYVLEEVLYNMEREVDLVDQEEVNDQQVQDRLRSLGYLE